MSKPEPVSESEGQEGKEGECYYCGTDENLVTLEWGDLKYTVCKAHLRVLEFYTGQDLEVGNE